MFLHLICDKKFAKTQIRVFEKYYPGQSLYVFTKGNDLNGIEGFNVTTLNGLMPRSIKSIISQCDNKIEDIFVYNANDLHRILSLYFKRKFGCKVHWMFFGSDLYNMLYYRYGFKLVDEPQTLLTYALNKLRLIKHYPLYEKFVANVDFFCFWNKYDYDLLKKYYKTPAKLKFYTHDEGLPYDLQLDDNLKKDYKLIQVNHSASWDGNHLTILRKIAQIDQKRELELLLPLNYGEKKVVDEVENYSSQQNLNVTILKDFMSKDQYFSIINRVNVAIFGHHRQEGGANLLNAFKSGTKVFLREDNNLLQLYKDWGIKVFSFEEDLNTFEDLIVPLSKEDKENNFRAFLHHMSDIRVAESMKTFMV